MYLFLKLRGPGLVPAPFESSYIRSIPTAQFHLAIAFTTIYWPALSRLKRHFTIFTARSAYCVIHLAVRPVTAGVVVSRSLCFTAGWATLGLISISPARIEFLFLSGKDEFGATVKTL
jgi:hypothetical protein